MFGGIFSNRGLSKIRLPIERSDGYPDQIQLSDFRGSVGVNEKEQVFCVKFKIEGYEEPIMQTFFKRYPDRPENTLWMGCGHATVNLVRTYGGLSEVQERFITDIVSGKEVKINSGHYPFSQGWIGKKIKLWDGK